MSRQSHMIQNQQLKTLLKNIAEAAAAAANSQIGDDGTIKGNWQKTHSGYELMTGSGFNARVTDMGKDQKVIAVVFSSVPESGFQALTRESFSKNPEAAMAVGKRWCERNIRQLLFAEIEKLGG